MKITINPSDKKFIVVTALLTVVVVAFLVLVPIQMQWQSLSKNKTLVASKTKALEEAREKEKNLPALRKAITEAEEEIRYVESRLPNSREVPRLLAELNQIAVNEDIAYAEMETLDTREYDQYVEIPLRIVMKSPYHDLGRFINNVENSDRFAKIDTINVAWEPENPMAHEVTVTLSTFMFVEKPAGPVESATSTRRANARAKAKA